MSVGEFQHLELADFIVVVKSELGKSQEELFGDW